MQLRLFIILISCLLAYLLHDYYYTKSNQYHAPVQKYKTTQRKLLKSIIKTPDALGYYKLHLLYYNGVPDKYDQAGNKIKGIEPDATKALAYLKLAYDTSRNGQLLLKMARIYQNGMYKLEPDPEKSKDLYYEVMLYHPELYQQAHDGYIDSQTEIKDISVYSWLNIKRAKKKNEHEERITKMLHKFTGRTTGNTNRFIGGSTGRFTGIEPQVIATADFFRAGTGTRTGTNDIDPDAINANDAHNTHNSQVVATVGLSLQKLQNALVHSTITPASTSLQEIRAYLNSLRNCDKKDDALKTLDTIERNIIPVSSINMTESEALNLVWNRIASDKHKENRNNIKEILYERLADAQEHGKSVCATGRLERIVDSLNTFDEAISIKPTYAIVQEMMDKAGKVRSEFFQNYENTNGPEARKQVELGTAVDQNVADQNMKDAIVQTLRRDYVDTNIMTDNKFQTEINKWIDTI